MIEIIVKKMIDYFDTDIKRINHAIKVYGFSKGIMANQTLSETQKRIVEYSAILHDIGIKEAEKKYNSTAGKYQEIESPPIAKQILNDCNVEEKIIERVCYIIANHHTYNKIDDIDFQILVEADFIVNIFEDGMNSHSIDSIKQKYFKTSSGIQFLNNMYLKNRE